MGTFIQTSPSTSLVISRVITETWCTWGTWGTFSGILFHAGARARARVRVGKTSPTSPTYTNLLIQFLIFEGYVVGQRPPEALNVPRSGAGRGTWGTLIRAYFFIDGELPTLNLVGEACAPDADAALIELKDAVAHPPQRLAEPGSLRAIIARSKLHWRLAAKRRLIKIVGADLRGSEPVPPRRHEASPHRALGVGGLHQFLDVAEKAFDARDLEQTAQHLRPVLIAADGARYAWTAGGNPALAEGEAGRDEPRTVGAHPNHQIGVAKSLALPGSLDMRVEPYTRKSSEEGLDMEFNSLDAQREACEAYIASQRAEGWVTVRDQYDDGGFSGGTLERPALQRLLADIAAGLIDVIVVYKIDRLSRALMDFSKLVEIFDRHNVTFVSVTQSFNTTTSMGRLRLNILLSFAQFEREVIGERIRDKFAASRKKGMWMGGFVPLGYDVKNRKLIVNAVEAATVRMMFDRFTKIGSATTLVRALRAEGIAGKRGKLIDKGYLYKLLKQSDLRGRGGAQGHGLPR